jgi:N utilization substance protein B
VEAGGPGGAAGLGRRWDEAEWDGDEAVPDTRAGARRLALQALYWESASPGQLDEALRQLAAGTGLSPENAAFAARLARLAVDHADELDRLISQASTHWRRERIARLDGLVLRLALAELLYGQEAPARVCIHEAVELAKAYGGDRSYAFVNGVLDAVARARGLAV